MDDRRPFDTPLLANNACVDGNRVTPGTENCKCGPECSYPCFQRLGLTDKPCCPDCGPLFRDVDERFDHGTLGLLHGITGGDFLV